MQVVRLASETDFDGWKAEAKQLRLSGVEPARVRFVVGEAAQAGLFSDEAITNAPTGGFSVPRAFCDLASKLILHRNEDRFDLMYRLLWRLKDEPDLLKVVSDADVATAAERVKNVHRASHKMKAFVRFRETGSESGDGWVAWFEPAHRVLEMTAPFFALRFSTMRWSILTPDGTARWDGLQLTYGPPARQEDAPQEDEVEDFWKTYYASTFNPARLRTKMMQSEMPKQYWKNLPEASLIPGLIAGANERMEAMVAEPAAAPNPRFERMKAPVLDRSPTDNIVPTDLAALDKALQGCRRCPLWRDATQGVCGVGPRPAPLMIVGEQPGDQEDLVGTPFVGPAGQIFDRAMAEAGLDRASAYVTNAVKHFKHEPRGKRRLHKTPNAGEVQACRWWLDQERALIQPRLILAMGATAGLSVLGRKVGVNAERGRITETLDGAAVILTVHPSYILRLPDADARVREREAFVTDLKWARAYLAT